MTYVKTSCTKIDQNKTVGREWVIYGAAMGFLWGFCRTSENNYAIASLAMHGFPTVIVSQIRFC
jgi:hypothetical protein